MRRFLPFLWRRSLLPILVALGTIWAGQAATSSAAERPNILLIVTDDQGYWDTGAAGNPDIETPNMDSLARDGVQFKRFYVAPVCAPTRAGIMTGRYYLRTGLYNTRFGGDTMGNSEVTVAQLLKQAGYDTGLFGKWHLGRYWGYRPNQRGFDEFLGHYHGHIERYQFPDQIYHNDEPVEARGYVTDLFTETAIEFIRTPRDNPFFCAITYNAPHSPWLLDTSHFGQPEGDKLLKKYLDKGLEMREARIYALVDRIDQNLGRLFAFLKESGKEQNTIVLFMSDNGGVSKHFKAGLKSGKGSPYEGGVRSPLFVRWPGKVPAGGMIEGQASHVDLLPTFCELAGAQVPTDRTIDGKSLVPLLEAGEGATHHRYVYHTWDRYFPRPDKRWSISDQQWKLVGMFGDEVEPDPTKWQLYDLLNDPGETKVLTKQYPEKVTELRTEFVRWFNEVTHGITYAPVPIPVGNPEEPVVEIQASWGKWEGPNTNYTFDGYDWDTIDGWRQPGEKVSWNLDVLAAGTYEVTVTYGCAPSGMGGKFRIQAADDSLTAEVKPTGNGEVFERFTLGTIKVPKGKTKLTVVAVEVKGDELMRLNRVWLRKLDTAAKSSLLSERESWLGPQDNASATFFAPVVGPPLDRAGERLSKYEISLRVVEGRELSIPKTENGIVTFDGEKFLTMHDFQPDPGKTYLVGRMKLKAGQLGWRFYTLNLQIKTGAMDGAVIHLRDGRIQESITDPCFCVYEIPGGLDVALGEIPFDVVASFAK